jgi:hypothetical protein
MFDKNTVKIDSFSLEAAETEAEILSQSILFERMNTSSSTKLTSTNDDNAAIAVMCGLVWRHCLRGSAGPAGASGWCLNCAFCLLNKKSIRPAITCA